jgi:hypothetical protein
MEAVVGGIDMSWESLEGVIKSVRIKDDEVRITTSAGRWNFSPFGDCCSNAFIHDADVTQEEFSALIGQTIVKAEESGYESDDYEGGVRDIHFYDLQCDKGNAKITLYVEHNGYYGGNLAGGKV